jgi:hypothetical protein
VVTQATVQVGIGVSKTQRPIHPGQSIRQSDGQSDVVLNWIDTEGDSRTYKHVGGCADFALSFEIEGPSTVRA